MKSFSGSGHDPGLPIWSKVAKVAKVASFFGITPLATLFDS
jgi:hypothetical protein